MEKFPYIALSGTPREIGLDHGRLLKNRILKMIEFYQGVFDRTEDEIFERAGVFKKRIMEFNLAYSEEIEAIAEGAEVDPLWIYALNARTEILTMFINECTAFYFSESSILSQNWDWAKELEELAVIMKITRPDGHTILQMTEPGIIGKIGFNSSNIGVTLNFLHIDQKLDGVPVHIILRSMLDASSIESALKGIEDHMGGKASNIIIANNEGEYVSIEFTGDSHYYLDNSASNFMHTNHFLKDKSHNTDEERLASSFARYERANIMLAEVDPSIEDAKLILFDQSNPDLPICRKYVFDEDLGNTGTICSIIMNLNKLEMNITRGNPFDNDFELFNLD